MLMLAQSAAHAQVFVLLRLSAFPKHIGHTKEIEVFHSKHLFLFYVRKRKVLVSVKPVINTV
jgi:hypothetical protein